MNLILISGIKASLTGFFLEKEIDSSSTNETPVKCMRQDIIVTNNIQHIYFSPCIQNGYCIQTMFFINK